MPDKSIKLIDTAAARVAISQHAVPAQVDDARKDIEALETELGILKNEAAVGVEHKARLAEAAGELKEQMDRLAALEKRWNEEKELIGKVIEIRGKLRGKALPVDDPKATKEAIESQKAKTRKSDSPPPPAAAAPEDSAKLLAELTSLQEKLGKLQGENPLIFPCVDAQSVAAVVADWTGIPVGRMAKNEIEQVLKLADVLESPRHRPAPRPRIHRQAHSHQPRPPR